MKHLSDTNVNSNKLENLPTPVNVGDATNKQYVDTQVATKVTGTTKITVGTTPPSSPSIGDIWIDTN